jgi:tetratricopeptide (TPR) repeat protein
MAKSLAKVLRFSTGTKDRPHREIFQHYFNRGQYHKAKEVVKDASEAGLLTPFEDANLRSCLAAAQGALAEAETYCLKARQHAENNMERAATYENEAFIRTAQGDLQGAIEAARQGIRLAPQVEGLWVNLLWALAALKDDGEIDAVLRSLSQTIDLRRTKVLRLHLLNDPDLAYVRNRPVFDQSIKSMLVKEASHESK